MLINVGAIYGQVTGEVVKVVSLNFSQVTHVKEEFLLEKIGCPASWSLRYYHAGGITCFNFANVQQRESFLKLCEVDKAAQEQPNFYLAAATAVFAKKRAGVTAEELTFVKEHYWKLLLRESAKLAGKYRDG